MVRAFHHLKFPPLTSLAIISVVALFGVAIWQATAPLRGVPAGDADALGRAYEQPLGNPLWEQEMILLGLATSSGIAVDDGTDPVEMIAPQILAQILGKYSTLIASGTYSPEAGASAAATIAPNVRALVLYTPYTQSAVKTTDDTSYDRMLQYREEMQIALRPLLGNTRAEYEIYGAYVESGDPKELEELVRVGKNYSDAASASMQLVVPQDAAGTHLEIANSLAHFSATLQSLALHADDPIGSIALLRTYNDTELAVVTSFDTFATYGRTKTP